MSINYIAAGYAMMRNAEYVRKALPNVRLPDPLRARVLALCDDWVSTYFDCAVDPDVSFNLGEKWAVETMMSAHWLARDIDIAARRDPRYRLAHTLVFESAVNIAKASADGEVEEV